KNRGRSPIWLGLRPRICCYEPLTTLSWLSTPFTPSTFEASCAARLRWPALATVPHRLTRPSLAVTSMAPLGNLDSGASSVCFTLAASSLLGSGFGGSGFTSGFGGGGGGVAGAWATGFGGGGGSEQAASASAMVIARMILMSSLLLSVSGK